QRGLGTVIALGLLTLLMATACGALFVRYQREGAVASLGDQEAPVSAILIVDTSPRMSYHESNHTRLETAQELAEWVIRQLPQDSELAVVDSSTTNPVFALDRATAQQSLNTLQVTNVSRSMPELIEQAQELAKSAKNPRREIYVLTDLTQPSWLSAAGDTANSSTAATAASDATTPNTDAPVEQERPLIYILDVGSSDAKNLTLGNVRLSQETISGNAEVRISSELVSRGSAGQWSVELQLERPDPARPVVVDGQPLMPELELREQQWVTLAENRTQPLEFALDGLAPGTHHGQLVLRTNDGMSVDNVRHFTINVSNPWPILVVKTPGAVSTYLTDQLAPYAWRESGEARFHCDVIELSQLRQMHLLDYAAVALLDPAPLAAPQWQQLHDYVELGHGLAIFLGRHANSKDAGGLGAFNTPEAAKLLPGTLRRQSRSGVRDVHLSLRNANHPVLREFQPIRDSVPWNQFPVFVHWTVDDLDPAATVIMRYTDNDEALLERIVGSGRVLTMTTPISDPLNVANRPAWNWLPTAPDAWPFFVLVNEMFNYVVQQEDRQLNYEAGQPANVVLPAEISGERFQLFTPAGSWQDVTAQNGRIQVPFTDWLGAYRVRSDNVVDGTRGFCVNLRLSESNLDRIAPDDLDRILGKNQYRLARERGEIDRGIVEARIGRELYPWLVILAVLAVAMENLLSNRFYGEDSN
ncbi:MAG: VWA domain-containing protein, partial [Planctomycetales bacterium]|nr:VWA domain-containing protein [Planctomycetales bacterium]